MRKDPPLILLPFKRRISILTAKRRTRSGEEFLLGNLVEIPDIWLIIVDNKHGIIGLPLTALSFVFPYFDREPRWRIKRHTAIARDRVSLQFSIAGAKKNLRRSLSDSAFNLSRCPNLCHCTLNKLQLQLTRFYIYTSLFHYSSLLFLFRI